MDLSASVAIEKRINDLRNLLRQRNVSDVDNHVYTYEAGTVFMDMVRECEKTGDYVMNVLEARLGIDHNGLHFKGVYIDTGAKLVYVDRQNVYFTRPEYNLLKFFLENPDRDLSREEIQAILPEGTVLSDRTVDLYFARVRKKIGPYAAHLVSRPDAGYRLQSE